VIDRTEALTAIDVNSGKAKDKDTERLALRTNLEAASEIARQLRLRDIGGLIVIDFIDMKSNKSYQKIEDLLRKGLTLDKAHFDITRISKFGMLEMSRERMRTAYSEASILSCPTCAGAGTVKSPERVAISALRMIHSMASAKGVRKLTCRIPVESANHMMNQLRERLSAMEREFSLDLTLTADTSLRGGEFSVEAEGAEKPGSEATPTQQKKKSRRGRGSRRKKKSPPAKETHSPEETPQPEEGEAHVEHAETEPSAPKKRRPRRRRRTPKKKSVTEEPSE
jgi:ribonuclease E